MLNDLRHAFRTLAKNLGFTTIAVATLALGLGASTAIFSVVRGVLLEPLPYPSPDRVMQIETVFESGFAGRVSYPNFEDLREQNRSFTELAAYADWSISAAAAGEGFRLDWAQVTSEFFEVLGVQPAAGRVFSADEERAGDRVAVASYGYWQSRLGGRPDFAGQSVRVGEQVYALVGVMPRDYDFPIGTDLWVPSESPAESRTAHNWSVIGLLQDGVSSIEAQQELGAIAQQLKQQHGDDTAMTDVVVQPILDRLVGNVRPALLVTLGAAGILLLVACVNVANLLLARGLARDREAALRLALGASPARLARIYLAESLLLALAGAALGVLLALTGVPALLALAPERLPRVENVSVDWAVLAFALTSATLAALLIGSMPALRAAMRDMREALADGQRLQGGNVVGNRLRALLVVAQIALTIVLLVAAGLVGRSFVKLLDVDPGFRRDGAVIVDLWLPEPRFIEAIDGAEIRNVELVGQLMEQLRALPGVDRVGGANYVPLDGGGPDGTFVIQQTPDEIASFDDFERLAAEPGRVGDAEFRVATADYFGAMSIPLMRGRLFDERDTRDAPHVAVVSASLAAERWPGEDPLGKLIQFGNMDGVLTPFTIVGVVGDVQEYGIGTRARPMLYADFRQRPRTAASFHIVIQGSFDVASTTASARRIASDLDAAVPTAFRPLRELVSSSLAERSFVLMLLGVFGGVAFVLAAMGIYGIVAYMAVRRTAEIGVRMALGARPRDVERLLVGHGAKCALLGVAVGVIAASLLTRLLSAFLYDVGAGDPLTFVAAGVALFTVAVLASWIPAYRAAKVDALVALRHE